MYMYFAYVYWRQFFRWQFSWGIFPGEQYSGGKYFRANFHRGFFRDILTPKAYFYSLPVLIKNLALKNVQTKVQ